MKPITTLDVIFGTMSPTIFIASMVFCFIGFMISKLVGFQKSKSNPKTPQKWSWAYWKEQNMNELLLNILASFVLIRFSPQAIPYFFPGTEDFFNSTDPMIVALFIGLFLTWIIRAGKDRMKKFKK